MQSLGRQRLRESGGRNGLPWMFGKGDGNIIKRRPDPATELCPTCSGPFPLAGISTHTFSLPSTTLPAGIPARVRIRAAFLHSPAPVLPPGSPAVEMLPLRRRCGIKKPAAENGKDIGMANTTKRTRRLPGVWLRNPSSVIASGQRKTKNLFGCQCPDSNQGPGGSIPVRWALRDRPTIQLFARRVGTCLEPPFG